MQDVIAELIKWYDLTVDEIQEDWDSGSYENIEEIPLFEEAETYRKTINYLIDANYMPVDAEGLKLTVHTKERIEDKQ